MTEPIRPIGQRDGLPAVTPVQRRRPRDEDDEQRRDQQREELERQERTQPRRPDDPERLIDVQA